MRFLPRGETPRDSVPEKPGKKGGRPVAALPPEDDGRTSEPAKGGSRSFRSRSPTTSGRTGSGNSRDGSPAKKTAFVCMRLGAETIAESMYPTIQPESILLIDKKPDLGPLFPPPESGY
jgi:hypothetical protein